MHNFVNSYQTKEERRSKYKLLLEHGATTEQARMFRDFTRGHLERIAIPFLIEQKLKQLQNAKRTE